MADTTFRTVLPALKAVDLGDGTHAMAYAEYHALTITSGRKTVAVPQTEEVLVGVATLCKYVELTAESNNTGNVAYGSVGATDATPGSESGTILGAGEKRIIPIADADGLYIDAQVAGDGVAYNIFS